MIDRATAVSTSTSLASPLRWSTLALVALVSLAVAASADQYASPGKITAASSETGLNLIGPGQKTSVDLLKSRKKMILVVHASAGQNTGASPQTIAVSITANGVSLEPGPVTQSCASSNCAVSATFFLDMDQAEAAHPGVFYNTLPMTVEATGISTAPGASGKLSLVAELLKK